MTPRVAATLAVRLIGLALVVWRIQSVAVYIAGWIESLLGGVSNALTVYWLSAPNSRYYLPDIVIVGQFVLGVYMLFQGKRLVQFLLRGLPGLPGICERCGYDVAGLEGGRCPECGAKLPERQ